MRCRISQLILCAHKKLGVIFDDQYYLNKILNYNGNFQNSLANDVQTILNSFCTSEDDTFKLKIGYEEEILDSKDLNGFKKKIRSLLEEFDFKNTIDSLKDSTFRGTGQPRKVLQTVSNDCAYHLSPLLRCNIPRYAMSKFVQAISGCNFLTPFDHSKKPKCRFCDHATADWTHLLFKCKKYHSQILTKLETDKLHPLTQQKIQELVRSDNHHELTDLLFCADNSPKFMSDLKILCPIVAKTCIKVERDWAHQQ